MLGYYSQRSDKFGNTINQNSENFYNLWVGFKKKKTPKTPESLLTESSVMMTSSILPTTVMKSKTFHPSRK